MMKLFKKYAAMVLIAGIAGFAGAKVFNMTNKQSAYVHYVQGANARLTNFTPTPPEMANDFTHAAEMTVHGVVHVKTYYEQRHSNNPFQFNDPWGGLFGSPFGQQQPQQVEASGSGVIITDDGYIATNNHVIENADKVLITLNDKREYSAKVIGRDPTTDLALLKIDEKGLPFISYGNSDDVKVGQWVLAVGNPFNLTSTVTAGIISAKGRNINILQGNTKIESFIQTDAAVNPGNSGGALVNTSGELIGINSAIASNTGSYTGYSFAIPVNIVKKVIGDLLEFGTVQRAFIGISIADIDSKLAEEKGIKNIKGVYVAGLTDGGAAQEAGVREGDVITKVGDVPVNSSSELQEQVSRFRPGDHVNVSLTRGEAEKSLTIVLKNKNNNTDLVKADKVELVTLMGAEFSSVPREDQNKLGISGGVKVSKLNGGKLRSAGIREGFIITNIDKREIHSTDDLVNVLQNKTGGVLIEGVYPNGMRAYYGFGL
ncbi:MAG: Do family serine endopeptidase [Bacteroidota bacterium]